MPSPGWRVLGRDNLLGMLRADLKKARQCVVILGPWIDDFFALLVTSACPEVVHLRVVSRPLDGMDEGFIEHARVAWSVFHKRRHGEIRSHPRLHAKLILIDEALAYCGSANWYRYSLEQGMEVVLRGPIEAMPELLDEVASIWDMATPESAGTVATVGRHEELGVVGQGYEKEVLDPIAAAKLEEVRGAFVLGDRKRGKARRRRSR